MTKAEARKAIQEWWGDPPYQSEAWQEDRYYSDAEVAFLSAQAFALNLFMGYEKSESPEDAYTGADEGV